MSYVTLPAVGSQIYVLPLGAGYLPASALALGDGTTVDSSHPLPVTGSLTLAGAVTLGAGSAVIGAVTQSGGPWSVSWSTAQHVIVDSATLGVVSVSPQSGATWDVSDRAGRALGAVSITGTLPAFASTPTVVLGAGSAAVGSVIVTSAPTTAITAASLPLPTGAATSALQGAGLPAALGSGGGVKIDGSGVALPVSGTVTAASSSSVSSGNSTTTTLGAGGIYTGTGVDVTLYAQVTVFAYSNVASATNGLAIQFSSDGTNWDDTQTRTVSAATSTHLSVPVLAKYLRVTYTNGGTAQGSFRLQTLLHDVPIAATVGDVGVVPVAGDQVLLTQSVMVGKTTGGGGGYVDVKVNPSGALTTDVTGTVTANVGTTGGLALDATLTGGTTQAQVRGGAKGATSAATVTSTASGADHQALDVTLYDASGARLGTSTNAIRIDPTGSTTQPVSGTVTVQQATAANLNATVTGSVTANIGTSGSLALDATLTGGTQKAIIRGGAKSTTTAADVTSTAASATRQPLDVLLYDSSGAVIGSTANRLITQPHDGTNPSFPAGAAAADAASNATVISQIGARLSSYNGSTWDRVRSAVTTIGSTFTGMVNMLPVALYNSSRTTRTTGQGGPLETDSTGALLVQTLDGNGNNSALVGGWDSTTNAGSALPAAGLVIKSSAGVFGGISAVNGTGGAAFLQVHNLAAASGYSASTLVFVSSASVANAAGFAGNALTGGIKCGTGIVAVWSSTQFTYTSIAANTGAVLATYR